MSKNRGLVYDSLLPQMPRPFPMGILGNIMEYSTHGQKYPSQHENIYPSFIKNRLSKLPSLADELLGAHQEGTVISWAILYLGDELLR